MLDRQRERARRFAQSVRSRPQLAPVLRAWDRDRAVGAGLFAGAIAFRTFVWLLSLALVAVAGLGFLRAANEDPAQTVDRVGVTAFASSSVSEAANDVESSRWLLLVVGLYALYSATRAILRVIWRASAIIWGQVPSREPGVKGVLAFNGIVVGALASAAAMSALRRATPGPGLGVTIVAVTVMVGIVLLALQLLPHGDATMSQLLPGALLAGVGLQVMHMVSVLYLPGRVERASETYGSLGTAVALLVWLYLFGRLLMGAIVLNASLADEA